MTIHIPDWIFIILQVYLIIGLLLWAPLNIWAGRFINPRSSFTQVLRRSSFWKVAGTIGGSAIGWPQFLWYCARDEWKHGLGRRWRR